MLVSLTDIAINTGILVGFAWTEVVDAVRIRVPSTLTWPRMLYRSVHHPIIPFLTLVTFALVSLRVQTLQGGGLC